MSNGKTDSSHEIYVSCTLTLDNCSFSIDLMSFVIKSFDVIVSMGWLSLHHVDIMCYENVLHQNLPSSETQVIYDEKPGANCNNNHM